MVMRNLHAQRTTHSFAVQTCRFAIYGMYLTVRYPAPSALFTSMVLALSSLAFTAVAITQPWVSAKVTPQATVEVTRLDFFGKYVCTETSAFQRLCVRMSKAEAQGVACCNQAATYTAASSLTYFSLACELIGLALSCCGTIKTKATLLSRFAAVVCGVAAVCHVGAFAAVLNSDAYHTHAWLTGLHLSEVNSRTIGLALAASIISAAFNLAACAVFVFAPTHWSRTMSIPLEVETMAGIHNPLKVFRGSSAERIAEEVLKPSQYMTPASARPRLDEQSFTLTGFQSSGSAAFSVSMHVVQQPAPRRASVASTKGNSQATTNTGAAFAQPEMPRIGPSTQHVRRYSAYAGRAPSKSIGLTS